LQGGLGKLTEVRQNAAVESFVYQNDRFTKTDSGQT